METQKTQQTAMNFAKDHKRTIAIVVLSALFTPFLFIGMAKAYEDYKLHSTENALNATLNEMHEKKSQCEALYESLVKIKEEMKLKRESNVSPCSFD